MHSPATAKGIKIQYLFLIYLLCIAEMLLTGGYKGEHRKETLLEALKIVFHSGNIIEFPTDNTNRAFDSKPKVSFQILGLPQLSA